MKILLSKAHVAVSGQFRSFASHDIIVSKLIMAGADGAGRKRVLETNVVVFGRTDRRQRESKMARHARERGIPVIDELQLKELLKHGELEVDDEGLVTQGDRGLPELVACARALLDGEPSSERWTSIMRLVDGCDPVQMNELVDYLAPQLDRWRPADRHARWRVPSGDELRPNLLSGFFDGLARGALRVAHPRWIYAAIEDDDPRLRLASHLRVLGLSTRQLSSLFTRRTLGSVRLLDLTGGSSLELDWASLAERVSWPSLSELRLDALDIAMLRQLEETDIFSDVRRLCVETRRYGDVDEIARTLASPAFRRVEEVVTSSSYDVEGLSEALRDPSAMPSLTTWEVAPRRLDDVWTDSSSFVHARQRVERIRLVFPTSRPSTLAALSRVSFDGLGELDLSGLMPRLDEGASPGSCANAPPSAEKHLVGSTLAHSVSRIVLGDLRTPALVAALERDGVEVTG